MKPDWKDAPDWANWIAMDRDGWWTWFASKPYLSPNGTGQWLSDDVYDLCGIPKSNSWIKAAKTYKSSTEKRP